MNLIKMIIAFIALTLSVGMYSQSASAAECVSCHIENVSTLNVHKMSLPRGEVIPLPERPMLIGQSPILKKEKTNINPSINLVSSNTLHTQEYVTGYKDEPAWYK